MNESGVLLIIFITTGICLAISCSFAPDSQVDGNMIGTDSVPIIDPHVTEFPVSSMKAPVVFYVDRSHPEANDQNPGSDKQPWKTIQHAADIVSGNARIIVKAGTYNERVTVSHSGLKNGFLIFEAEENVDMRGFLLYGDYLSIMGFRITGTPADHGWLNGGIWISGHNQLIVGNQIYDYINAGGIVSSWAYGGYWEDIQIISNYISGCNAGIDAFGQNWLVMGNEINHLVRGEQGRDADYMRFFGYNLVIKNNYFHGTKLADIRDSHVDVFQTFYQDNGFAFNVLIEHNIATDFYHQGLMAEAYAGSHINIQVRSNVFAHASAWGICAEGVKLLTAEHNVFYFLNTHGVGFRNLKKANTLPEGTTGSIKNNIFMNVGANAAYWKEAGCTYHAGYNLIYPGSAEDYATTDIAGKAPLFTNPDNIVGPDGIPFTDDDGLHLQAASPGCNAGDDGLNIGAY